MLDVESEQKIMTNLKNHFNTKTIISIAHRMQTLRNADRIWVLDEGSIAQEGTHDALMQQKDGLYYGFMRTYVEY
jgi:ATP-binding cassette, subfamily B, bacterial RtxE